MVIELPAILEPDDFWPWFSCGHTNEYYFVAKHILVVKVRGLGDAGTLYTKETITNSVLSTKIIELTQHNTTNLGVSIVLLSVLGLKLARWGDTDLTVFSVSAYWLFAHTKLVVGPHATRFGVITLKIRRILFH